MAEAKHERDVIALRMRRCDVAALHALAGQRGTTVSRLLRPVILRFLRRVSREAMSEEQAGEHIN